jgi:hypothetical protein
MRVATAAGWLAAALVAVAGCGHHAADQSGDRDAGRGCGRNGRERREPGPVCQARGGRRGAAAGPSTLAPADPALMNTAALHDAVSITTGSNSPVIGDLELRYTVPDNASADAVVAYLDEQQHRWIPVPTERSGNQLVATAGHLTTFGWFDDLRLMVGEFLGSRAAPLSCWTAPPDSVRDLIATQGADAQVLACTDTAGGDVKVKVKAVNNGVYPVATPSNPANKARSVDKLFRPRVILRGPQLLCDSPVAELVLSLPALPRRRQQCSMQRGCGVVRWRGWPTCWLAPSSAWSSR